MRGGERRGGITCRGRVGPIVVSDSARESELRNFSIAFYATSLVKIVIMNFQSECPAPINVHENAYVQSKRDSDTQYLISVDLVRLSERYSLKFTVYYLILLFNN